MSDDLLTVKNLRTGFQTHGGLIRAVDGVDFSIPKGGTLGVVGESGSGKSVTALSIMKLVDAPGRVEASSNIIFDGQDLATLDEDAMAKIRGNDISMIFQEPMTSLNPVFTVGEQIAESVRLHQNVGDKEAEARARIAAPRSFPCSSMISAICASIVCSGLSEVIGSWKMMVMSLPRTRRISRSGKPSSSCPLKWIVPERWLAAG